MFAAVGDQRMMAMEILLAVEEFPDDPDGARLRITEASAELDRILGDFARIVEGMNVLVIPEMQVATDSTIALWEEMRVHLQTVAESGTDTPENAAARAYIASSGRQLADFSSEMSDALATQMEATRSRIWVFLIGAVVLNIILLVGGYLLIRHRIVIPLRRLEAAAANLRSGRLEARVESAHDNEIGLVERAFNEMAMEIQGLVASLEERRNFAESLITHAPVGVVVHRDSEILFANPHFLALIGASSLDDAAEHALSEILPPEDDPSGQTVSPDNSGRRPANPYPRKLRLRRRGEGTRTVEAITVPIDHEGRAGAMTLLQDVTERDELAARMMQIDRVAALGTLLAGMGHEINNPLSYLANNLEYSLQHLEELREEFRAEGREGLPPAWEVRCSSITEALRESGLGAERIRDIVSRLRGFSRIDDTAKHAVSLEGAIESSIRMADGEIRHRARLVRNFSPVAPVEANESQIGQVFLNLLINAAHAVDEGNAERDLITISLFQQNSEVIVEVSDTGTGIPAEIASRVFDPFFTTKPPGQGTGLGLAICQKIVESHGGLLTFRTREGGGTTLRVSLPAAESSTPPPETSTPPQPTVGRRRLAIIDDDPMVCRGLKRLLDAGNEVETFTDPHDFLEALARDEHFDVVFCDLMMPGMTGMEVHDILEERYPEIHSRTVFMTGGAFTPQAEKFLANLRSPLLLKPFDLNQVRDLVARTEAKRR